jgi:hypothetical protein
MIDQDDSEAFDSRRLETPSALKGIEDKVLDFRSYYVQTYRYLHSVKMIPKSVCDEIFKAIQTICKFNDEFNLSMIQNYFNIYPNNEKLIHIIESYFQSSTLMNTTATRIKGALLEKAIKNEMFYVQPEQIEIEKYGTNHVFHYVPILKTLKAIFRNDDIRREYFKSILTQNENEISIKSFCDTEHFKKNQLFSKCKRAIQIKLFINGFCPVNSLSDCKNEYKMTAVYFKIGNLPHYMISENHATQLAIMCPTFTLKELDYHTVFEKLINDIKILEEQGIDLFHNNEVVNLKGTICYIVADNLGANGKGGFVESFNPKVLCNILLIFIFLILSNVIKNILL